MQENPGVIKLRKIAVGQPVTTIKQNFSMGCQFFLVCNGSDLKSPGLLHYPPLVPAFVVRTESDSNPPPGAWFHNGCCVCGINVQISRYLIRYFILLVFKFNKNLAQV